jgi:acyl transferase domain-containing protein/acyl carrier protein
VLTGQIPPDESSRLKVAFLSAGEAQPDSDTRRRTHLVRPSLGQGRDVWQPYLASVADLYVRGAQVDWVGLYGDAAGRRVPLPTYPFQRERHWFHNSVGHSPAASTQPKSSTEAFVASVHPLLGHRLATPLPTFELQLEARRLPYLRDHRVHDMVVLAPSTYLEMALAAAKETLGNGPLALSEIAFSGMFVLPADQARTLQVILNPGRRGEASFHVFSLPAGSDPQSASWSLHATGRIARQPTGAVRERVSVEEVLARLPEPVSREAFYREWRPRGLHNGSAFQGVSQLWRRDGEALGRLRVPAELESDCARHRIHPALLDAGFQVLAAAVSRENHRAADASAYLPVGLDAMRFHDSRYSPFWSHALIRPVEQSPRNVLVADVRLLDEAGMPMVEIDGLRFEGLGGQASLGIAARPRSASPRIARHQPAGGTPPAVPETESRLKQGVAGQDADASAPAKFQRLSESKPAEPDVDANPRGRRRDGRQVPEGGPARRAAASPNRSADEARPFRERLRAAEPGQRQQLLEDYLSRRLADVLGLGSGALDVKEPLFTLGIDSLMVFKLGAQLERELGIGIRMTSLLEGPSVSRLSAMLLSKMDET